MKLLKVFYSNFLEVIEATFMKIPANDCEIEIPLPSEADMNLTASEYENKNRDNLIELAYEYQVNVFIKWLLFTVTCSLLLYSFYLAIESNLLCILTCIPSFLLHKFYVNSKILAGMKKSLIEFSFIEY